MNRAEERIVSLMRETGQPCIVSGIAVEKYRSRCPPFDRETGRYVGRLQVSVWPSLSETPSAYRAKVGDHCVSIRAACSLIKKQQLRPERRWHIRGRFRLADAPEC